MHESAALAHLNTVRLCVQYQIWRVGAHDLKSKMHSDTMKKERVERGERHGDEDASAASIFFAKLHFEEWIISWRTEGAFTLMLPQVMDDTFTPTSSWHFIHTLQSNQQSFVCGQKFTDSAFQGSDFCQACTVIMSINTLHTPACVHTLSLLSLNMSRSLLSYHASDSWENRISCEGLRNTGVGRTAGGTARTHGC